MDLYTWAVALQRQLGKISLLKEFQAVSFACTSPEEFGLSGPETRGVFIVHSYFEPACNLEGQKSEVFCPQGSDGEEQYLI